MHNYQAFFKWFALHLIPVLLPPWTSVQADMPVLPEEADCAIKIKRAVTAVEGGTDSAMIFRYSEKVPNNLPHSDAKYPISFEKKVIGISPSGSCMELELKPIFKTWWSKVPIIRAWWGKVPIEIGPDHDKRTSLRAYLLFGDSKVPSDLSTDDVKIFGYRISSDEDKKDDYRGEPISGFLSDMIIVVTVGDDSYFGASKEKLADDPQETAYLRYWHAGIGDPESDDAFVVLCNRDCKGQLQDIRKRPRIAYTQAKEPRRAENPPLKITLHDTDTNKLLAGEQRTAIRVILDCRTMANPKPLSLTDRPARDDLLGDLIGQCVRIESNDYKIRGQATYSPDRQEVIIPVTTKIIISLEDVEVRITLANDTGPLPDDCAPFLDYYQSATLGQAAESFRLVGQDILKIDQYSARIERLDPHGRLALRFEEGSCELDEKAMRKREIKPLLQRNNKIEINERAYLTKPILHVIFAFDKTTTGKVIEEDFTADVIKQIIDGLDQAAGTAGFHQVKLYAYFQDDDRKRQKPFKIWAAGGFPSATKIEKLARKPLGKSGPSESHELTDERVERFIRSITNQGSRSSAAGHKAVFLFVGRHELNPAAICKSTTGGLARIEKRLEAMNAKAVLIDFYTSPHALVDASSSDFPHLEPLGERDGKFPFFRCIEQGEGEQTIDSSAGRLSQIIVNWGGKTTRSWRSDLTQAVRGLQEGPLRP